MRKIVAPILAIVITFSMIMTDSQAIKVQATSAPNRVVGYFPSYRMHRVEPIDFSAMTHCILAFMTYKEDTLTSNFSDYDVEKVISKCHANNVKGVDRNWRLGWF